MTALIDIIGHSVNSGETEYGIIGDEFCILNPLNDVPNSIVEMDLLGKTCMYKTQTLRKLTVYSHLSKFVIVSLPFL